MVEGIETRSSRRQGRLFGQESQEELKARRGDMDGAIVRTVEFGTVGEGRESERWKELPSLPRLDLEGSFKERGGFY